MKSVQIVIVVMEGPSPEAAREKRQKHPFGKKQEIEGGEESVSICVCLDMCERKQERE